MIIAVCSWALTLAFVLFALRAHLRLVLVARACHELRGPLFAVQLGLHGLVGDPARLAAIELELARAGRALDDLAAAPHGRWGESRVELVDIGTLLESYAPAWRTLAAGYGATLLLEPSPSAPRDPSPRAASSPPAASAASAAPLAHAAMPSHAASPAGPPSSFRAPSASLSAPASSGGAFVSADPLRIAQACANLIGNAAEHGEAEVRVRVRAGRGVVRIEVADDGPGLPASVTTMTAQARRRRGRRGHGLAIAAAIAADSGGRLFAAPSASGARVVFELPAAARPPVAA